MGSKKLRNKDKQKPIRLLVWGDSPAVATGFATVTRNVFSRLARTNKYIIDVIGINDSGGWKDPQIYGKNMRIYPAIAFGSMDVFGRGRLINSLLMKDPDLQPPWDLIFTINDPFILEEKITAWGDGTMNTIHSVTQGFKEKFPPDWWSKTISYWPIDSELKQNWYEDAICKCDYPVAYAQYGKEEIEKIERRIGKSRFPNPLSVIYHGVDTSVFKPLPKDEVLKFRQHFFQGKISDDTFVCMIVARNQPRKDIPRAMKAFKEFQKRRPKSFLYIHAKNQDAGGTLAEYGNMLGLKEGKDYGFPSKFSENRGYPLEVLNMLYNVADVHISTTLGEGFGLPFFEAMSAGTLNLAPDNTTVPELFNIEKGTDVTRLNDQAYLDKIRGISVKSGSNHSEYFNLGSTDKERFRPLTNVEDMIAKLLWIYDNPDKAEKVAEQGRQWVQQYDWDIIAKQWDDLFTLAYTQLEGERAKWTPPQDYKEGQLPEKLVIKT